MCGVPAPDEDAFAQQIKAAAKGEEWAWAKFHEWLAPRVRGYLAARGMDDPDQGVGGVFVHVARSAKGFKGSPHEFEAHVFALAKRYAEDDPDRLPQLADPPYVISALGQLPPEQREVLLLLFIGRLDMVQIGTVIERDPPVAADITRRALGSLSRVLF